jgi:ABC-type transport system involved in cytochrome c biogenesis permease subunit
VVAGLPALPRWLKTVLYTVGFILLAGCFWIMCRRLLFKPLMPVLRSPLLVFHIVAMIISYSVFGLVAILGIAGLAVPSPKGKETLRDISLTLLYPAVFLIAFGIFIGAVWANISWGNYWGWDPKETWALITMLVYSFALHGGSIKAFRKPAFFHAYMIVAFLSVLVTYYGVNLLLGGMHSYM